MWGSAEYIPHSKFNLFKPKPFFQDKNIKGNCMKKCPDTFYGDNISSKKNPNNEHISQESEKTLQTEEGAKCILLNEKDKIKFKVEVDDKTNEDSKSRKQIKSENIKNFYNIAYDELRKLVRVFYTDEKCLEEAPKTTDPEERLRIDEINLKEKRKLNNLIKKNSECMRLESSEVSRVCLYLLGFQEKEEKRKGSLACNVANSIFGNINSSATFDFEGELFDLIQKMHSKISTAANKGYKELPKKESAESQSEPKKEEEEDFREKVIRLLTNLSKCYPDLFKNSKLENLVYRMHLQQYFLNTALGKDMLDSFIDNFNSNSHNVMKYKLIIDRIDEFKKHLGMFNSNLKEISTVHRKFVYPAFNGKEIYGLVKKLFEVENIDNTEAKAKWAVTPGEIFTVKNLIESTIFLGDIWNKLLEKTKIQNALRAKLKTWKDDLFFIDELNGIQGYLEGFKFDIPYRDVKPIQVNILNTQVAKLELEINQIEGVTTRLLKIRDLFINLAKTAKKKKQHKDLTDFTQFNNTKKDKNEGETKTEPESEKNTDKKGESKSGSEKPSFIKESKSEKKKKNEVENCGKLIVFQYLNVLINLAFYKKMTWEFLLRYYKSTRGKQLGYESDTDIPHFIKKFTSDCISASSSVDMLESQKFSSDYYSKES